MTGALAFLRANWLTIGLASLLAVSLLTAGVERSRRLQVVAEYAQLEAKIERQKTEAADTLRFETDKVRDLEGRLSTALADQNTKDAQNAKVTSDLERRLADAGRLRDPKAAGRGGGGGRPSAPDIATTDSGPADSTEGPGLLSAETSDDLRDLARQADEINTAYISCRADSIRLRELFAR